LYSSGTTGRPKGVRKPLPGTPFGDPSAAPVQVAEGIGMFGVEAVSPGRPGRNNFEVHHVCRDLGFTHMEGLVNLDKLVGKGRFRFIGFPIKIKGGTGAPIRAVAWLDG